MTATLPRPAGSPMSEDLLAALEGHIDAEQDLLDEYAALAGEAPEHVRYLVELILDDERRHHRILGEMANRVQSDIEFRHYEPAVPYVRSTRDVRDRLIDATERLLALEKHDLRELKGLGRDIHRQRDGGLFPLLVKLMELDTKKHIAILEFIRDKTAHPYR